MTATLNALDAADDATEADVAADVDADVNAVDVPALEVNADVDVEAANDAKAVADALEVVFDMMVGCDWVVSDWGPGLSVEAVCVSRSRNDCLLCEPRCREENILRLLRPDMSRDLCRTGASNGSVGAGCDGPSLSSKSVNWRPALGVYKRRRRPIIALEAESRMCMDWFG